MNAGLWVLIGGAVLIGLLYNSLVGKKNQVENVFAGMDAILKKRYDLIPNLISTVKTYMKHEQGTLTEITEIRAKAISGNLSNDEKVELDNKVTKALGGIMVAVENYPDLKANQNFLQLQRSLNEIEEQISAARRAYNAAVTDYNNSIEMAPTNILASVMRYQRKQVFEISQTERQNVNVKNLFNQS
ncbi:MAG: LemA family protein [Candidatus Omnitrophica bacterium]|nr:LemA family protein [Candidatus Omnitrophota bacterium]